MAKNRQDLVDEAAANLGVIQKTPVAGSGTKTTLDLVNKVLFNIGVLGEGQTASAEAYASVTAAVTPVVAQLSAGMVVDIPDINAIPNVYFFQIADIVADAMKSDFGVTGDDAAVLISAAKDGERRLKNLTRIVLIDRNLDQILANLAALEVVYLVDVTAIPDEWFTLLAAIVADQCRNKFELDLPTLQKVAADGAQALSDLRTLTRGRPSFNTLRTCYM